MAEYFNSNNRYGVLGPHSSYPRRIDDASCHAAVDEDTREHEDAQRQALVEAEPVLFETNCLVKWMTTKNFRVNDDSRKNTQNSGRHPVSGTRKRDPFSDFCFNHGLGNKEGETMSSHDKRKGETPASIQRENSWEKKQRLNDNQFSTWEYSKSYQQEEKVELDSMLDDDSDCIRFYSDDSDNDKESGQEAEMATPRIIALVGHPNSSASQFAKKAFEDTLLATSCNLDYKAWIHVGPEYPHSPGRLLQDILAKLDPPVGQKDCTEQWNGEQLMEKLTLHLRGKKFLIVLEDVTDTPILDGLKPAFPDGNCSPGSAILVTTRSRELPSSFSSYVYETLMLDSERRGYLAQFYSKQASGLLINQPEFFVGTGMDQQRQLEKALRGILRDMALQTHNCRLFLSVLCANPNQTSENILSLRKSLKNYSSSKNKKIILMFAYNSLSSNCKNCLLYLTIFPENTTFRRARLVRRWVADGMITKRGGMNALEEADRCLKVLVAHSLVTPIDTDVTGKVKRFKIDNIARHLITEIATNENFFKTNLPPDLACRLPIRSAVQQQQVTQILHAARSQACWNICSRFGRSNQTEVDESNATTVFLESLPSLAHLGLLEVLDLEDCKELSNHHLKNICNSVFQLKYLSLRYIEITELPKQIDKLHYLETLDIRQTKVRAFARSSARLPKLKHLLAGHQSDYRGQDSCHSEESFLTVQMPKCVGSMTELQVLSRVAVSGSGDVLNEIGSLLQLRKLGLVLSECQKPIFRHLYHAIGNLSRSLRTLSIQIIDNDEDPGVDRGMEEALLMPPKYLQKLKIFGFPNGLPSWVKVLKELTKITLHKTLLTADHFEILGDLTSLSHLRLRQVSSSETTLTFSKDGFQSLKFLVLEFSEITNINFVDQAAPKLKKVVWFSIEQRSLSLSGMKHLQSLKELELSGNFVDLERVKRELKHIKINLS